MAEIHEAIEKLPQGYQIAEHFAATIKQLRGKVTMLFIRMPCRRICWWMRWCRSEGVLAAAVSDAQGEPKQEAEEGVHG